MPNSANLIPFQRKVDQLKKILLAYPLSPVSTLYNTDFLARISIAV